MGWTPPHPTGVDAPEWPVSANHSEGEEKPEMKITRAGIDIAKSVFHVHAVDRHDRPQWRAKLKRNEWLEALCDRLAPGAEVGMEACASAHHWSRELQKRGFRVKLIAAQFVKPYVKSNKNDHVDAEAICEAMGRPGMRFVASKSVAQQDRQAAHRIREGLIGQRTAKANQIRGLVGEYGLVAPVGIGHLRRALPEWLEDAENGLTDEFRVLLANLAEDLRQLDDRIVDLDEWIAQSVCKDPVAQRLMKLRGIGPLTASALSGALGDGRAFSKGRDFAASLGLTPRQHSTGGKDRLLGISKRGDPYLRKLLVHGARAVIRHAKKRDDVLSLWIRALMARKHANVAAVALANKTARVAWAIVHDGTDYDPTLAAKRQGAQASAA
jgi:transposase